MGESFCSACIESPGSVFGAYGLLLKSPELSKKQIADALTGKEETYEGFV